MVASSTWGTSALVMNAGLGTHDVWEGWAWVGEQAQGLRKAEGTRPQGSPLDGQSEQSCQKTAEWGQGVLVV
jgi:hypothetical protein